jgi:hypothetical protein
MVHNELQEFERVNSPHQTSIEDVLMDDMELSNNPSLMHMDSESEEGNQKEEGMEGRKGDR